jgi:hypothetical protein
MTFGTSLCVCVDVECIVIYTNNKKLKWIIVNFISISTKDTEEFQEEDSKKKATKYLEIDRNLHLQIVHLTLELIF